MYSIQWCWMPRWKLATLTFDVQYGLKSVANLCEGQSRDWSSALYSYMALLMPWGKFSLCIYPIHESVASTHTAHINLEQWATCCCIASHLLHRISAMDVDMEEWKTVKPAEPSKIMWKHTLSWSANLVPAKLVTPACPSLSNRTLLVYGQQNQLQWLKLAEN